MSDAEESSEHLPSDDVDLIRPLLDDFKSAKKAERKNIIRKAVTTIMGAKDVGHLKPLEHGKIIAQVKEKVKTWFHNHGRSRKSKDAVKYVRRWNVQQVVGVLHQKEVEELCRKHSNAVPGDRAYLKSYQKVLKRYAESLSDDQQAKYHDMANEWSDRSPPPEVQQRMAELHGAKYIKQFARVMWLQCGIRLIVLEAHNDTKGELCIASHDFNHELGGETFADVRPEWQTESIMDEWAQYAQSQMGDNLGDGNAAPPLKKKKKKLLEFDRDDNNAPILDDPSQMMARAMEPMVRQFMSIHYNQISNGKRAAVDWAMLLENQDEMIDAKYLPAGFKFRDPSKLKKADYQVLLEYWYERQVDEADPVFTFKGYWDPASKSVLTPNDQSSACRKQKKRKKQPMEKRQAASGKKTTNATSKATKRRSGPPGIRISDAGWSSGLGEDENREEEAENRREKGKRANNKSKVPPMPLPFAAPRLQRPLGGTAHASSSKLGQKQSAPKPAYQARPVTRSEGKRKAAAADLETTGESLAKKVKKARR